MFDLFPATVLKSVVVKWQEQVNVRFSSKIRRRSTTSAYTVPEVHGGVASFARIEQVN